MNIVRINAFQNLVCLDSSPVTDKGFRLASGIECNTTAFIIINMRFLFADYFISRPGMTW